MVDHPLVSNWPVRPNVFLNIFLGLFLGVLASFAYITLAEQNIVFNKKQIVQDKAIPDSNPQVIHNNENNSHKPNAKPKKQKKSSESYIYDGQIITMYDHMA